MLASRRHRARWRIPLGICIVTPARPVSRPRPSPPRSAALQPCTFLRPGDARKNKPRTRPPLPPQGPAEGHPWPALLVADARRARCEGGRATNSANATPVEDSRGPPISEYIVDAKCPAHWRAPRRARGAPLCCPAAALVAAPRHALQCDIRGASSSRETAQAVLRELAPRTTYRPSARPRVGSFAGRAAGGGVCACRCALGQPTMPRASTAQW